MEISAALAADIDDLCTSVGSDLERVIDPLAALNRDLRLAVRSYLGLQLVLADRPLGSLTAFTPLMQVEDIATSLYLPLSLLNSISNPATSAIPPACSLEPMSALTLYAASPGAFVELADDLSDALGLGRSNPSTRDSGRRPAPGPGGLRLDEHLGVGPLRAAS